VAALLTASKIRFVRRSEWADGADVLLLDTFGELAKIYRYATASFIGGSLLLPTGGHNPIEPAAAGVPVCFGPHMTAFREVAAAFLRNEGAKEIKDSKDFAQFVEEMTSDEKQSAAWGERARKTVAENRGASERTARRIVELLS
jgi:3-deoxy-D-manno-octulosonic-acid transferase